MSLIYLVVFPLDCVMRGLSAFSLLLWSNEYIRSNVDKFAYSLMVTEGV